MEIKIGQRYKWYYVNLYWDSHTIVEVVVVDKDFARVKVVQIVSTKSKGGPEKIGDQYNRFVEDVNGTCPGEGSIFTYLAGQDAEKPA
jgi:hypothetical protein